MTRSRQLTGTLLNRQEANIYVDQVFGAKPTGYFGVAFKVQNSGKDANRPFDDYEPRPEKADGEVVGWFGWKERKFNAADRDKMLDEIEARMAHEPVKVMISPSIYNAPTTRTIDNIKRIRVIHVDYDGTEPMDPDLFAQLRAAGALLVWSSAGTHKFHAYIGVKNMTLQDHYKLIRALRNKFGGDAKVSANDLLTLPGSHNIKDPANLREVKLITSRLRMWASVDRLVSMLDLDLDAIPERPSASEVDTTETLTNVAAPMLRQLIRLGKTGGQFDDLSDANFRQVKTCKEKGLTPGQTYTLMTKHLDADTHYKWLNDDWFIGDIARIWDLPGKNDKATPKSSGKAPGGKPVTAAAEPLECDEVAPRRLKLTKVSSIKSKRRKWLWKHRIPSGALTLIAGREGSGKGNVTADLAARITRGEVEGEYQGQPRCVIFMTTEDDYQTDVKPRLQVAGADLDRVFLIEAEIDQETEALSLTEDQDDLAELIRENDVALLVLDPIKSALGEGVDAEKEKGLRKALESLNRMAGATDCAVLGIMHFNKRDSGDAGVLMSGLLVWSQVARQTLGIIKHPENTGEFILGNGKANNAPATVGSLHGRIVGVRHKLDDGEWDDVPKVEWIGEIDEQLSDIMAPDTPSKSKAPEIQAWLKALLEERGSVPVTEVLDLAKTRGYGEKSVRAAQKQIGAKQAGSGKGPGTKAYWSMMTASDQPQEKFADPDVMEQISNMMSVFGKSHLFGLTEIRDETGLTQSADIKAAIKELHAGGWIAGEKIHGRQKFKFVKLYMASANTVNL